ncbi:MAG TPA: FlgD immunoglobulin-like domain containing protein [bacterium]|nr:FlgD immunoglobulin-like domain containing protein [bacterium]
MHWPRETLIQLYLEDGLSPEARREFERLSRRDPSFTNEVTEAVQKVFRHLPPEAPKVPKAPQAPAPRPWVWPRISFSKFRPWIGLGMMALAALGAVWLLADWIGQSAKASRHRSAAQAPAEGIRQVVVKNNQTPESEDGAIGVSPSLSAAGRELVFQEGDRIYLSIQTAQTQSVTLSVVGPGGFLIRKLYSGQWQKGAHEIFWDGMNSAGHPVPPGIYSVLLKADGKTMSDRLVIQPAS